MSGPGSESSSLVKKRECALLHLTLPLTIMVPKLSVEILEMIIDHVAMNRLLGNAIEGNKDPLDTFRACALTCSSLRPRAHYHLYKMIRITRDTQATSLLDIVQMRPSLAQYVRTLQVELAPEVTKQYRPSLISPLPLFTNITQLVFCSVYFAELRDHEAVIESMTQMIPASVRKLSFFGCIFQDDSTIADIIQSVPDLHTLNVECCFWTTFSTPTRRPLHLRRVRPQALIVKTRSDSRPWMNIVSLSSLTELEFNIPETDDVAGWRAVLHSAPYLRTVTISDITFHQYEPVLDLHRQQQLETLHVKCCFRYPVDSPDPVAVFLAFLSSTRSERLSRTIITLGCMVKSQLDQVDWSNVKAVVEGVTWESNPRLVVELLADSEHNSIIKEMKASLLEKWSSIGVDWLHLETRIV
jgi:hypothetical protein